jgi:hypothetical protein
MAGAIVRIVINTLNSDFTNTGGSNNTTNTGSNGTGGGNGSGGNTQINSEYGKFLGSLPSSARVGDTVSVTFLAQLGASEMTALRNNLNAQCGSNPTLSLEISGQAAVQDTMSVNPTSLASTVSTKVTGSAGNRNITVKLCGMNIANETITIQEAGSAGTSARYTDDEALAAAARSSFTIDMVNDEMVIKISASPDDVKYMCDAPSTSGQNITVTDSVTNQTLTLGKTQRQAYIQMQEGDPIPEGIFVKICGFVINQK